MAKVTYIHQHFRFPEESGGGRPWEFARRLSEDGHEVTVICGGQQAEVREINRLRVIRIRSPYSGRMGFYSRVKSFLFFMALASIVAVRTRADVVFASSTPLTVAVPGILGSIANRARFVFEVRDLWPTVPIELEQIRSPILISLAKYLERITYSRAAAVIALSDGMAKGVRTINPSVPISVVPNASDCETFNADELPERDVAKRQYDVTRARLVVYAGNLGISYDPQWLAEYCLGLMSRGVEVRIAGSGVGTELIAERLVDCGFDPNRVLLGPVPRSELAMLLRACDATVSSLADRNCLRDNSLNKVFDSLAAGRAIVANHQGWLAEIIEEEHIGILVPRDANLAVHETIRWLESRDVTAEERRAVGLAASRFSRDRLYEEFRQALTGKEL